MPALEGNKSSTMAVGGKPEGAVGNGVGTGSNGSFNSSHVKAATPEEFVRKYGGRRVINKILIANNGIAGKRLHF